MSSSHDKLLCTLINTPHQLVHNHPSRAMQRQQRPTHPDQQEPSEQQQQRQLELHPVVEISTSARRRTSGMKEEDTCSRASLRNAKECIMMRRQADENRLVLNKIQRTRPATSSGSLRLICLAPALAALVLLAATLQVGADGYAPGQQQQDVAYGNNNNYEQQQQAPSKAKKIQIVYIKVPLAKLKPSLANSSASYNNDNSVDNSTAYASQQHVSAETTKQQGSQSVQQQQKLNTFSDDFRPSDEQFRQQQQQQSSFLIPMAVVSNSDQPDSAASVMEPSASASQPDELAALHRNHKHQQQQQQQQMHMHMHNNHLFRPMNHMMMRPHAHMFHQQQQQHVQSPMQLYQQLMAAADSAPSGQSVNGGGGGVQQGFMSSFLLAEKERMAAAAMRLQQQGNLAPVPAKAQQSAAPPALASASTSTSAVTMQPAAAAASSASTEQQQTNKPAQLTNPKQQQNNNQSAANSGGSRQAPGGLMPVMMMPLSHMPDTMIGQAYNAAVGQALPSDTAPGSLRRGRQLASKWRLQPAGFYSEPELMPNPLDGDNLAFGWPPELAVHSAAASSPAPALDDEWRLLMAATGGGGDAGGLRIAPLIRPTTSGYLTANWPMMIANSDYTGARPAASSDAVMDAAVMRCRLQLAQATAATAGGIPGSPASMLGSPSNSYASDSSSIIGNNNQKGASNYAAGGNNGIAGDSSSSLGTASSTTYGANGLNQHDASSSGTGYQHSASASASFAPSSGYGSGINTFGASVAFSDFPTASGPSQYGAQQASSNNNHQLSHSAEHQVADQYAQSKLRQAKKTIIPIVVQVEHAILENNAMAAAAAAQNYAAKGQQQQQHQPMQGNRYGGRGLRQVNGGKMRGGYRNAKNHGGNQLFGSATNDAPIMGGDMNAQYLNAANAQDINQITAQINAENAASAAAALAQADMAFGGGAPAYLGNQQPQQHHNHHSQRPSMGMMQAGRPSSYASGLQSAASALLANTHPVIQAAASTGISSATKLGAKLGEMIALPSMQVPGSISALPSAISSIASQMGVQLNQAVQQVAKEHPTAHAFARQVAQHAGIQMPNFVQAAGMMPQQQHHHNHQAQSHQQFQPSASSGQMSVAASNQQQQQMSPQAQLQNLKLSIGQNLQTAAAQLIGVHQKANAQSAASLLSNPLAALYPQSMNAALKQLSGGLVGSVVPPVGNGNQQAQASGMDSHHAQSSSLVPVQQQANQQQQQVFAAMNSPTPMAQLQSAGSSSGDGSGAMLTGASEQQATTRPAGKASLKSKFLSFFQPPKFFSNLLSWNDRADARNDQGSMTSAVDDKAEATKAQQAESSGLSSEAIAETLGAVADDKTSAKDSVAASNATSSNQSAASSDGAASKAAPVALEASKEASSNAESDSSAAQNSNGQTKKH